jgi:RHS repeat-associated protein
VVNHLVYDSFGNIESESNGAVDFRFGYTGREFDEESGQYYYRARYYDAGVGRFLSEDPISFSGGDANLYRYVSNAPTISRDPMGLQEEIPWPRMIAEGLGWLIAGTAGWLWQQGTSRPGVTPYRNGPQPEAAPSAVPGSAPLPKIDRPKPARPRTPAIDPNCQKCSDIPYNTYTTVDELEKIHNKSLAFGGYQFTKKSDVLTEMEKLRAIAPLAKTYGAFPLIAPDKAIADKSQRFKRSTRASAQHVNVKEKRSLVQAGSYGFATFCRDNPFGLIDLYTIFNVKRSNNGTSYTGIRRYTNKQGKEMEELTPQTYKPGRGFWSS